MLVQGMNYLLDIKQDLLVIPNDETIASNQQSAISNQQSIAADCLLFSHNKSFLLCKERL